MSLSLALLRLTATPAVDPSRQDESEKSIQVHLRLSAVSGSPVGTKGGRVSPPPPPPAPPSSVLAPVDFAASLLLQPKRHAVDRAPRAAKESRFMGRTVLDGMASDN